MEDHKLKVFCTVAETKSFSKASEIIHLTQPAVSLQIQALEDIYETKLFDRSSSTVSLTPAGEILYRYAKQILGLYTQTEKEIARLTGFIKGSIRIGASTTIANYLLPSIISDFNKLHKKARFHLLIGNTKRIVDHLNNGVINFGLVEGDVTKYKLKAEKLLKDELVVIVSSEHTFANRKNISVHELTKEPFILREEGSGTRQVIEKYLAKFGLSVSDLNISAILGGTEAIKEAVEDGVGISFVSKWAVRRDLSRGTLKMIPLKEERLTRDFSLIYKHAVLNAAESEFLNYLKKYEYEELFQRRR